MAERERRAARERRRQEAKISEDPLWRRKQQLKTFYKMTWDDYLTLLASQDGRCANPGCRVELVADPDVLHGRGQQVDHDHSCCPGSITCGRCVRGVLCAPCNLMIGSARDCPERLAGAIEYLSKGGQ